MSGIELLAPAGNAAALHAAVQSGADAVYIGGHRFNARRGADNFSAEDIKKYADYCHLYGVDVHAAVNTLIKERELLSLVDYVYELNDAGVDALIVQDIGAAELIKRAVPNMTLHASTQMTVTSLDGVKYLADMGFSRVVLARELSMTEIEYICAHSDIEIEVFVHGAICMCYSGQCLMSSIIGGRSGNRGMCAQPCRLPYEMLKDGKRAAEGYLLSPKDMALINELQTLQNIGVKSLKIEGRLKRAEYVSAVVGIYRKYIDAPKHVSKEDMKELTDAFSRSGFTDGYFKGKLGADMMSFKNPSNASDNVFTDAAKKRADINSNIRKIPIDITGTLKENGCLEITMTERDTKKTVVQKGTVKSEKAINRPLDVERMTSQLLKLGDTPFEARDIKIDLDGGITIPIKEINAVRREAASKLLEELQKRPRGKKNKIEIQTRSGKKRETFFTAEVWDISQAKAAVKNGIKIIYAKKELVPLIRELSDDVTVITKASEIFSDEEIPSDGVLVSSAAAIEHYRQKELYGDFRLNVFNSETANHYKNLKSVTLSPELNLGEIRALTENTDVRAEVIGYGRLTLMIMKNCPMKASGNCGKGKGIYRLKDRKREEFPLVCGENCTAKILNSKPVFMADKLSDLTKLKINSIRLIFTVENFSQCDKIINVYKNALHNEAVLPPEENSFTRGHYYRGVD